MKNISVLFRDELLYGPLSVAKEPLFSGLCFGLTYNVRFGGKSVSR